MTRKLIITIQFILVGILCIGCSGKQKEPNIREAQIIELSQEQVSIDENLQLSILLNNTIHLIDMTYYEILKFSVETENKNFYFANIQNFYYDTPISFVPILIGIIEQGNYSELLVFYYDVCYNCFYLLDKSLNKTYTLTFQTLFKDCEHNKVIGARQYKLYKAICNTPRATMDEIVDILEEEL